MECVRIFGLGNIRRFFCSNQFFWMWLAEAMLSHCKSLADALGVKRFGPGLT